ncbi:nuclease-related domain-containing protein [Neisseria sp. 23W00296]|uniref:nuclease-related domain-containing protein n=1 Tax=unclassified Neisseria TaxID=2623750 RepID=UPI00375731A8
MIIKHAENRNQDIEELTALLALPYVDEPTKRKIKTEIRKIHAGMAGEKEAAYHIDFHFGNPSKNWAVIHDFRVEYEGRVAQIDHLLLNRMMEIYICESKNFNEGVAINENGEFSYLYEGKTYGMPSPIEQNERHRLLLKKMFDDGEIAVPTRLGLRMKPAFYHLILIGNSAQIHRPQNGKNVKYLDRIIKSEQVRKRVEKDIDEVSIAGSLAVMKTISRETLYEFAEYLASFHRPSKYNWKARFGISEPAALHVPPVQAAPQPQPQNSAPQAAPPSPPAQTEPPVQTVPAQAAPDTQQAAAAQKRYFCADCRKSVSENAARYCWSRKALFQNRIYCFDCQKKYR